MDEELASPLTRHEKKIRDRFVAEYVKDYNRIDAAIRIGYSLSFAEQYSTRFMTEPYVLQKIASLEQELGQDTDDVRHRRTVVAGLYRIATSRYASASAQVAAYAQIAKIQGLEAPIKTQAILPNVGGVDYSLLSTEELQAMEAMMAKASSAAQA